MPRDIGIKALYYLRIAQANIRLFVSKKGALNSSDGGIMGDGLERSEITESGRSVPEAFGGHTRFLPILTILTVTLAAYAIATRLAEGPHADFLLMIAATAAAVVLALHIFSPFLRASDEKNESRDDRRPWAGAGMAASRMNGSITASEALLTDRFLEHPAAFASDQSEKHWDIAASAEGGKSTRLAPEKYAARGSEQTSAPASAGQFNRHQQILLDAVADGICGVDQRGMVSFANPAALRLLGASAAGLTGNPMHELLHGFAPPSRKCGSTCPLRSVSSVAMPSSGEDTFFRTDGSSFPAEYTYTPIVEQGSFSGCVLSFRDISQRYALDRLKDEFISTVSHELRTPLTSIRGALGLLTSGILGDVNEKAENLLRIALANSDRLVRLINDILDLERIQSGREPLAFHSVQLAELVHQAIEGMQPVAESAGVKLIHDSTQAEVSADADRILQVLTNLLSNAIKFSPPNSTVSVMMRPDETGVTVSVIDNGRGIPADKLEAVFGRFQQVDASDSRQKGGSGLGLAICRTIVMQHSGRIWAERNPVRGTTLRVFLPHQPSGLSGRTGAVADGTARGNIVLTEAGSETPVAPQHG